MNCDYALENKLKKENPELSKLYTNCVPIFDMMLRKFFAHFPTFTDHTLLHSLSVINLSNYLIGEHISELNADEIYVYLLSTAMHDVGMGVNDRNFKEFMTELGLLDLPENEGQPTPNLIRKYHHELSGKFIMKYYDILDIPNERYAYAIAEVSRGHRKTNLLDESQFPTDYEVAEGRMVNLARLGALLRVTDELDMASDRNPDLIFATVDLGNNEMSKREFSRHRAITDIRFESPKIFVDTSTDDDDVRQSIIDCVAEAQFKLDYCREVMTARGGCLTDYDELIIV